MAVQQTPVAQGDQEMDDVEEEPEEIVFMLPNGEERLIVPYGEDTPATNTRSSIPKMSARTYRNLFKGRD